MVTGAIIVVAVRARMQVSRSFPRQEEGPRTGGTRQGEHPLHVPRHGDEGPLTLDIFEPTQQELAEAHHRLMIPNTGSGIIRFPLLPAFEHAVGGEHSVARFAPDL